jgi:hypothetical protein
VLTYAVCESGEIRTSTGRDGVESVATTVSVARAITETVSESPLHTTAVVESGEIATPSTRSPVGIHERTVLERRSTTHTFRERSLPTTASLPSFDTAIDRHASASGGGPLGAKPSTNPAAPWMS